MNQSIPDVLDYGTQTDIEFGGQILANDKGWVEYTIRDGAQILIEYNQEGGFFDYLRSQGFSVGEPNELGLAVVTGVWAFGPDAPLPVALFYLVSTGLTMKVDASNAFTQTGIKSITWHMGEVGAEYNTPIVNHVYSAPGVYTVTCTIVDNTDKESIRSYEVQVSDTITTAANMHLGLGQSLSVGQVDTALWADVDVDRRPSDNVKMFVGIPAHGAQNTATDAADVASLVPMVAGSDGSKNITPMLSFAGQSNPADGLLIANCGVGGTSLENLSDGGSSQSWPNLVKYIAAAPARGVVDITTMSIIHGGANWSDAIWEYQSKFGTYLTAVRQQVAATFPSANPTVVVSQHGGEDVAYGPQAAQLKYVRDNADAVMTSGTYWVHRQHPNRGPEHGDPTNVDRQHLNPTGYLYLGDMIKRAAEGAVSVAPQSYAWVDENTVDITVNLPAGENLVIDTNQPGIPEFNGYGIEMHKLKYTNVEPTSVKIIGANVIRCVFPDKVEVGDSIRVGYSPRDKSYFTDQPNDIQSTLTGTNIRASGIRRGPYDLPDYYDWLALDVHIMEPEDANMPAFTRGSEVWRNDSSMNSIGYGEKYTFDGTNRTRLVDGQEDVAPTNTFVVGTSNPRILEGIEPGDQYEISCVATCQGADMRIGLGRYARLTIPDGHSGPISGIITVDGSWSANNIGMSLRILSATFVGSVEQISIRRVLA